MVTIILVILDKFNELVFEMIGRLRSRAASSSSTTIAAVTVVVGKQCQMRIRDNFNRIKSKAASVTGIDVNNKR